MRNLTTVAVLGVLLGVGPGWTAGSPGASRLVQEAGLVLAGTWVLNDELSDDPRAGRGGRADDEARRRGGRPGFGGGPDGFGRNPGGFGGRGGRGGRLGGRGGGRPDPEQAAGMREAVLDLMTAPRRMTIAGNAEEVVLTYNDGRVVRLIPDGREHAGLAGTRARVTRTTRWRDATLETDIELQAGRALSVRQTYDVQAVGDGNSRQLIVTTHVRGGRLRRGDEREIRRVYDEGAP